MTRGIRIGYPGAFYHVVARGNQREKSLVDDDWWRPSLINVSEPHRCAVEAGVSNEGALPAALRAYRQKKLGKNQTLEKKPRRYFCIKMQPDPFPHKTQGLAILQIILETNLL